MSLSAHTLVVQVSHALDGTYFCFQRSVLPALKCLQTLLMEHTIVCSFQHLMRAEANLNKKRSSGSIV